MHTGKKENQIAPETWQKTQLDLAKIPLLKEGGSTAPKDFDFQASSEPLPDLKDYIFCGKFESYKFHIL